MTAGNWMREYFREGDEQKIKQAVKEAEKKTKGDIVPMIVHRSSSLSHVAPTLFLLMLVLSLLLGTRYFTEDLEMSFLLFAFAACVWSFIFAFILSRLEFFQRLVIPQATRTFEVHQRAELEFYRNHFDQTKAHGAVLIFVSLFERKVVVLCDEYLKEKVTQKEWDSVSEVVSAHMQHHRLVQGLIDAILLTGQILSKILPGDEGQLHEISTDFVVKE